MTIQEIKDLFASGGENKQKQAIEEAIALAKQQDKDTENMLLSIKTQFNNYLLKIPEMSTSEATTQFNKITAQFLGALGMLENHLNQQKKSNITNITSDIIGRDKIDRQINLGDNSTYIESQNNQQESIQQAKSQAKQKILFLAANPTNEARLQTDKEYATIMQRLKASQERDKFELLKPVLSMQVEDLIEAMNQKPEIVHFSGHGSLDGIIITNAQNEAQVMPTDAIKRLFKQHKDSTKLVVLNACYSAEQAKVISEFGIYVIGMHVEIADEAAISFAGGLYIGLGAGKSIEKAFDDAMIVISTTYPNMELVPEIWKNGEKLDL
ncbi:MAG: CHAT domain-containing protein [Cytophagales bacterium]|nr:MAG: CHAT domain-containing protein [Cytophagales bacterium]